MRGGDRELRSVFLVGAPRCGTTSLIRALRAHPQLCVSQPKETYFFTRPPSGLAPECFSEAFVSNYFRDVGDEHRALVEGTPHNLYSDEALGRILAFDEQARFLVSVRNPVDLVYSHHGRLLFTMDEDVEDFAAAWALQEQRARGDALPQRCREPHFVQYRAIGALGTRLEALIAKVGHERCHVVVYDDIERDGGAVLQDVLKFIGVDPTVQLKLGHQQRHAAYRAAWLQPFVMNPPRVVARLAQNWESKGKARAGFLNPLRKRLKAWNKIKPQRAPLPPALRDELRAVFADETLKLAKLLDRDLSHWA